VDYQSISRAVLAKHTANTTNPSDHALIKAVLNTTLRLVEHERLHEKAQEVTALRNVAQDHAVNNYLYGEEAR